jgi:ABC-type uncharacterized transport system ATPase component
MAEQYFAMAREMKPALMAARKCYVIAAENAQAICQLFQNQENETKTFLTKKIQENV